MMMKPKTYKPFYYTKKVGECWHAYVCVPQTTIIGDKDYMWGSVAMKRPSAIRSEKTIKAERKARNIITVRKFFVQFSPDQYPDQPESKTN
jgi:hypothetical protein